jgi:hypothetical protein
MNDPDAEAWGELPSMPKITRKMPRHDAMPVADPRLLKERARKAWQAARQRSALPPVMIDKLWADGLLAARSAPAGVASVMMYRSEVLFSLLCDRGGWLQHDDAPPRPASPHPKMHMGPRARWDR